MHYISGFKICVPALQLLEARLDTKNDATSLLWLHGLYNIFL